MKKTCRRKMGDADDYAAKLKGVKQDCASKLDAAEQATVQKVGFQARIPCLLLYDVPKGIPFTFQSFIL